MGESTSTRKLPALGIVRTIIEVGLLGAIVFFYSRSQPVRFSGTVDDVREARYDLGSEELANVPIEPRKLEIVYRYLRHCRRAPGRKEEIRAHIRISYHNGAMDVIVIPASDRVYVNGHWYFADTQSFIELLRIHGIFKNMSEASTTTREEPDTEKPKESGVAPH